MQRLVRGFPVLLLAITVLACWTAPSLAYLSAGPILFTVDGNMINLSSGVFFQPTVTAQSDPTYVNTNVTADIWSSNSYNIVAWTGQKNNAYTVFMATYNPYQHLIAQATLGPYDAVSDLTVAGGVVSFISTSGTNKTFRFATYDPGLGLFGFTKGFRNGSASLSPSSIVVNQNGVVAWTNYIDVHMDYTFTAAVYDPTMRYGVPLPIYQGTWVISAPSQEYAAINSLSVNAFGTVVANTSSGNFFLGYDPGAGSWSFGANTKGLSYFVSLPTKGPRLLQVWYTDMSIGATSWHYDFGDGSLLSTSRSWVHGYNKWGKYLLTQIVTTSEGNKTSTQTITVTPSMGYLSPLLLD